MKNFFLLFSICLLASCAGKTRTVLPFSGSSLGGMNPCDELMEDPDYEETSREKEAKLSGIGKVKLRKTAKHCRLFAGEESPPDCGIRRQTTLVWEEDGRVIAEKTLHDTECFDPSTMEYGDFGPWQPGEELQAAGKTASVNFRWHGQGKSDFGGRSCKSVVFGFDEKNQKISQLSEKKCRAGR